MQDPHANYFATVSAFEKYWENREVTPHSGWKVFKRWEYFYSTRHDENGRLFTTADLWNEYYKYLALNPEAESVAGNWVEMGPRIMPLNATFQPTGLGRINGLAFHPTDQKIIYVGSASGGLWTTLDSGITWTSNTDNFPTLGVSSILVDPVNPSIMYIGTGDRDASDAAGMGVRKSIDGGVTWVASNSGMGNLTVGMMVMNRLNRDFILAATSGGIYRSNNAGASWVRKSSNTSNYKDIKYKPGDTSIVYATEGGNFYRSNNGGNTWTLITGGSSGLPTSSRLVIGVSPANPNIVYAVCANGSVYKGTYRSTDAGLTFSMQSTTPNIMDYSSVGSGTGGQAWYDMCVVVDTINADHLYVGGVNIFKSVDGGKTWKCKAHWGSQIHADQHFLAINPLNNRVYVGNDGGIYYSKDTGQTWVEITSGIAISQIYRLSQSAQRAGLIMNGYQDNGTATLKGSRWRTGIGGDGMECIIDYMDSTYLYGALYYGDIRRSTSAGNSFGGTIAANGTNGITESGAWVTPYVLNSKNPAIMYVGYKNVWRTKNARTGTTSWTKISNNLGGSNSSNMTDMESCQADSNILYISRGDGKFFRTDSANAIAPTWVDLTSFLPVTGTPTDIETHPIYSNRVYIVLANKIYKSYNKGNSWTEITSGLPSVTKSTLVLDRMSTEGIYVGTDAGIYYRDSTMTTWVPFRSGMPVASRVTELEMYYDTLNTTDCRISASTYGRGTWQSDVYLTTSAPVAAFNIGDTNACVSKLVVLNDASTNNPNFWRWTISPNSFSFVNGTNANLQNPQIVFNTPGVYSVSLFTKREGWGYSNLVKNNFIKVSDLPAVSIVPVNSTICKGKSTQITAIGASSFTWSPSIGLNDTVGASVIAKPDSTITYRIIGLNGANCRDTAYQTITVIQSPTVDVTPRKTTINAGNNATLTASGATTYSWSPSTGLNINTGAVVVASPVATTTYTVTGSLANGCSDTAEALVNVTPSGLDNTNTFRFQLIPNPNWGEFLLATEGIGSELSIYDLSGRLVMQKQLIEEISLINCKQLAKGVYQVFLQNERGIAVRKLVIN